jgi:hypothetical protein
MDCRESLIQIGSEVFMPTLRTISAVAALVVLCACAGQNAVKPDAGTTSANQKNPACLSDTGSRLPSGGANCSAYGRSYSSDDIDRTGSSTAGGALRLLDPSLTVTHP